MEKERTAVGKVWQIRDGNKKERQRRIVEWVEQGGQLLLPFMEMLLWGVKAIDDVVDEVTRRTVEAMLHMSAMELAGERQRGREGGGVYWHGSQGGVVPMRDRKLRVEKPRLRRKGGGKGAEVEVPLYKVLRERSVLGKRMEEVLLKGTSTRGYESVVPAKGKSVGVKKSSVSRQMVEASAETLGELNERRFDGVDLLAVYVDGIQFGRERHVIGAVGVDGDGYKRVLGIREGASENATVVTAFLEDLGERGVDSKRRRLFVIDGSKALRKAIDQVFGDHHAVQRCRNHKKRNVAEHLPEEDREQAEKVLVAAFKLKQKEGKAKLEQYAQWMDREHPGAAASLREGLEELFTIKQLGVSDSLERALCTTNIIDSTHSGIRQKLHRVTNWKDGDMILRWVAAAFLATEKNYRRISGYRDLWMLQAALGDRSEEVGEAQRARA